MNLDAKDPNVAEVNVGTSVAHILLRANRGDARLYPGRGVDNGARHMSTFDNPFDSKRRLNSSGCACGRHASQLEHERDAQAQLQCLPVTSNEKQYENVVASAVMRA